MSLLPGILNISAHRGLGYLKILSSLFYKIRIITSYFVQHHFTYTKMKELAAVED